MQEQTTFCRICEPACSMIAKKENGRIISLEPDHGHPSGGIACHKGLSYLEVHNDPDRLNRPRKRSNPKPEEQGEFTDISWDQAITEIGNRLKSIREQYGPDAIAFYTGNPTAFDSRGLMVAAGISTMIGSRMNFGANSQDTANKCLVAGELYGSTGVLTLPDLPYTDYFLCIGSNPKVSRWGAASIPNDAGAVLRGIKARGGRVRFVNPRKIESSTSETGETLLIKPGADVYFIAALLNEVQTLGGFKEEMISEHGKNIEGLKEFISRYPAEKVVEVTGISAEVIKEEAAAIVKAKSAAFNLSTGVNQSRQGNLCYWLLEMLSFVTGNLGRKGGNYRPNGYFNTFTPNEGTQVVETSIGDFELPNPAGAVVLPGAMLPDLIESGDIRALVSFCGNPVLSIPGEERLQKAFEKLDTLVSIDILPSVTAEVSDYVLAATDFLEREDITLLANGMQQVPYVQYTDAVVEPGEERREIWWILASIVKAMGLFSPLDEEGNENGFLILNQMLGASGLSVDKLRELPRHTAVLEESDRESFYEKCVIHADKKVDCCPESFGRAGLFTRCDQIFSELENEPRDQLKMISLRTTFMHNSWLTNIPKLRRGKQMTNPLNMCEQDAARLGLFDGDKVQLSTKNGSIETTLLINDDLRPGAVAMSHGYGHNRARELHIASDNPGANCNFLMPSGPGTYEPLSYMSWISGVPVSVEKSSPTAP